MAGSVNVPLDELPGHAGEWAARRVLLFCNAGSRSRLGWTTLVEAGLPPERVYVMAGARAAFEKARTLAASHANPERREAPPPPER